jgi:uncharacterized protein (UPF0276 family)
VDALTTMLDPSITLTTNEWTQWGNPIESREAYEYILSYSPYDNIAAKDYPAMMVTTGLWDSQVGYFEPAKYVASVRRLRTDSNPLILDINLDDPDDFDPDWLDEVHAHIAALNPAWLCGDAGMWHLGRRDRGHMLLLPPILTADAVQPLADGVMRLREATGLEVLPENPPGVAWVGDLHLLDFFGRVAEAADTGLLLDCAHLALYQRQLGHAPLTGLDAFPLDRVIELHIAGGAVRDHDGLVWVEDDHSPAVLDDTWQIVEHVLARAPNLKAIFIECERNPAASVRPLFDRVRALWPR